MAPAFRRFASWALAFDEIVAAKGFPQAARSLLPRLAESVLVRAPHPVPSDRPLLVAANHPGGVDGLALAAALGREDVRLVVSGMSFLRHLPATAQHLIFSSQQTAERMAVVRSMLRQLRQGGAVIIFPTGTVDPDPELMPGLQRSLDDWSPSLALLLERVPETHLVVAVVSGVLLPWAYRHPLPRLRRVPRDQQKAAEILQIARQAVSNRASRPTVHVSLGAAAAVCGDNSTGWIRERGLSQIGAHLDSLADGWPAAESTPLW